VNPTQTPPAEHLEFDRLCEQVEDFEHLPSAPLEHQPHAQEDEADFDQLILAGLVSPA
jgi:hypothetical protein